MQVPLIMGGSHGAHTEFRDRDQGQRACRSDVFQRYKDDSAFWGDQWSGRQEARAVSWSRQSVVFNELPSIWSSVVTAVKQAPSDSASLPLGQATKEAAAR